MNTIPKIHPAQVSKVYNGKPGCACGCRGVYSTTQLSIAMALEKLAQADPATVERTTGSDGEVIYFWDSSPTRTHTIYVNRLK